MSASEIVWAEEPMVRVEFVRTDGGNVVISITEQQTAWPHCTVAGYRWKRIVRAMADQSAAAEGDEVARLRRCLGFFASVIKGGEPWTATCEREYAEALGRPVPTAVVQGATS